MQMQNGSEISPGILQLHQIEFEAHEKRACTFLALASLDTVATFATEPTQVLFVGLDTGKRHSWDSFHWEITSC